MICNKTSEGMLYHIYLRWYGLRDKISLLEYDIPDLELYWGLIFPRVQYTQWNYWNSHINYWVMPS